MTSSSNPGRVAGFLYLLLGFSVFRPIYVEGAPDRGATVRRNGRSNIATHESLFPARYRVRPSRRFCPCLVVALALYRGAQTSGPQSRHSHGAPRRMHPSCDRFSQLVERYCRAAARAWRRFPVSIPISRNRLRSQPCFSVSTSMAI